MLVVSGGRCAGEALDVGEGARIRAAHVIAARALDAARQTEELLERASLQPWRQRSLGDDRLRRTLELDRWATIGLGDEAGSPRRDAHRDCRDDDHRAGEGEGAELEFAVAR
jgi:hypothetical protein